MNRYVLIAGLLLLVLGGCQGPVGGYFGEAATKTAVSERGMAVAAQPLAAQAARDVLEDGGNAADAAVAAGFVIAVVEQTMNSVGGRSQILVRVPGDNIDGRFFAYNGMTEVPAGYSRPEEPARNGYTVIGVPGVVSSLARLHEEHGSMPWARLLAPAIGYAMNGFTLLPGEAARHRRALDNIRDNPGFQQNILKRDDSQSGDSRANDSRASSQRANDTAQASDSLYIPHAAGETLQQRHLAATLSDIAAAGGEAFYEGDIAAAIAADMQANGGHVTAADLAGYETLDGRYLSLDYRGYTVHSIAAPAGGGLVVKALNIMEEFPLHEVSDSVWAAIVNQALALAIESMDEDYHEADLAHVLSEEWAAQQARRITVPEVIAVNLRRHSRESGNPEESRWLPSFAQSSNIDTPPTGSAAGYALASPTPPQGGSDWSVTVSEYLDFSTSHAAHTSSPPTEEPQHTTHFVTADCSGMAVSVTQTVGPLFGSKVITPGLGFVYASTMGSYLSAADQSPGSRPRTTIAPTIVTKDGRLVMVLGAAGGLRILSGIVQTVSRHIDRGMNLEEAVAAPRVHPEASTDAATGSRVVAPRHIHAETTPRNGWSRADIAAWEAAGFTVEPNEAYAAFSRVHALAQDKDGQWVGAADLDWEGAAFAPAVSVCDTD